MNCVNCGEKALFGLYIWVELDNKGDPAKCCGTLCDNHMVMHWAWPMKPEDLEEINKHG